jgi:hypothetical protein
MGTENLDALLLEDLDELIGCVSVLRAKDSRTGGQQRTLAHLEKTLRKKGDAFEEAVAGEAKIKTANPKGTQPTDDNSENLEKVEKVVNFSKQGLVVGAEKYDDYFFRLNTGYEFVAIDKFFDKGEPRISLLMNRRLGGDLVTDDRHGFWGRYGGRSTFAAILESSAEATVQLPDDSTKSSTPIQNKDDSSANMNVTKTFAFELQYSWIFFRSLAFGPNNLRDYIGLIVAGGGLKTDAEPKVISRLYYGLRTAINPEFYADFMYGHTSGLHSNRLEVRGQFPVMSLSNGDRIFLGGIGNFAIDKRQRIAEAGGPTPLESDIVRVYITWNTDLKHIFGSAN